MCYVAISNGQTVRGFFSVTELYQV